MTVVSQCIVSLAYGWSPLEIRAEWYLLYHFGENQDALIYTTLQTINEGFEVVLCQTGSLQLVWFELQIGR